MCLKTKFLYINNPNNKGQAMIMMIIFLPLCFILLHKTIFISRLVERKIKLQNGIDASLLSSTEVLADGLNKISKLNNKLTELHYFYLLSKAGKLITRYPGFAYSEEVLKQLMKALITAQDLLKMITPPLAFSSALIIARKNETPHVFIQPLTYQYPIERTKFADGMTGPYKLNSDFLNRSIFMIQGFQYRHSTQAKAQTKLHGTGLTQATWKGVLVE